ncbi:MAG: PTS transporter subunit EIIC [Clostridium sp.]|uniref:PTS transporter subunit EIIC n=1 Tax=Clostridium sp. TaxID=1506 RepID=UPI0029152BD2|nr:PTS transporter subunit EIIC [Clostridium sp.]MDU4937797.1 PTS transporter subunit EIIC [Clostridium sp.]
MKKEKKFQQLADNILGLIGGKENVVFFTHCITRLRFNIKDKGLVKVNEIEKISGVVGCQWSGEQLQVIIGQSVGDAYQIICEKTGLGVQETLGEGIKKDTKQKISVGSVIDSIAGCITPLIPVFIGCGMIKVLVLCLEMAGLLDSTSSTYSILSFAGDAGFYFMPILAGKTSAKKLGANEALGMLLGAILVYPSFVSGVAEGTAFNFLGIPIYGAGYANTIFPIIISVWIMVPVQKFIGRISPDSIRSVSEPLLTILVMIPLMLCVLAPAGAFLGNYMADAILWLYDTTGFLGVAVLSAILPWLVVTGMHSAFTPYMVTMISTVGYEPIYVPAMVISNINQGVACAAVALKTKKENLRSTGVSCAITAIVGGVSEPALFGINLKYKTPLYGAMIGSFFGALVMGIMKVYIYAFPGSGGIFSIPSFMGGKLANNVMYLIVAWIVGAVITFIATLILYKEENKEE